MDHKATLQAALSQVRQDLVSKLDGLDEYDVRRPLVPTGTNLLGLVKHVGAVSLGYLSVVFGRDPGYDLDAFFGDNEDDLWAKPAESRQSVTDLFAHAARVGDATIAALDLDSTGAVPWWPPERRAVTLQQILVHLVNEVARHAGQADILREMIDGQAGRFVADPSLTERTADAWLGHRARLEQAALEAAQRA